LRRQIFCPLNVNATQKEKETMKENNEIGWQYRLLKDRPDAVTGKGKVDYWECRNTESHCMGLGRTPEQARADVRKQERIAKKSAQ
jgi:hypothetical protein